MKTKMTKFVSICLAFMFLCCAFAAMIHASDVYDGKDVTEVSVSVFYKPNDPEHPATSSLLKLMEKDKGLEITQWGGIALPGGGAKASLMMSIAGGTAPDIGEAWFHIIGAEIRNGFMYPLNEWIGDDLNGNGQIDDDEAKWEPWKDIHPLWRKVATHNGKVYGIPQVNKHHMGVIFRTDLVRMAGLDPNNPPETWEEFQQWCFKLSKREYDNNGGIKKESKGYVIWPWGWTFLPWIQSAGGDPIVQYRKHPETGEKIKFSPDATSFIAPDGKDLSSVPSEWQADFTSDEAVAAAKLYHDLIWQKWIRHPKTQEEILLTKEDLEKKQVQFNGENISFNEKDVFTGSAYPKGSQRGEGAFDYLSTGEAAMISWFVSDLNSVGQKTGINPDLLSWFPFPKGPGANKRKVVQVQNHYAVMYEGVKKKTKKERDQVWKVLQKITSKEVSANYYKNQVLSGLARFCPPEELKKLGYDEYLKDFPEIISKNYEDMDNGTIVSATEPFMGFWYTVDSALGREVLSLAIAQTGENFDYETALKDVENKANGGMMFKMSSEDLDEYRPQARVALGVVILIIIILVYKIIATNLKSNKGSFAASGSSSSVYNKWLAWGMVIPALLLIALWSYYPLFRGMVMAFQDYKVTGDSKFVGLDNFILLFMDKSFWMSILRTFYFVGLNMLLAFTAPILLAVLLTDIPKFRILLRTVFFLPQMSSGLVIALLWKLMYEPTPQGFFNQLITMMNHIPFVDIDHQQWLQDPSLAMICVVLPTVWASMGMASLIYLAALASIPRDMYEAAEIDGAGLFSKFKNITVPSILPLIIINFVGAFIGTFQNMGNIFLMTFGGPGESTTVVDLKIWIEAYINLRFSMATTMAWVLGSLLIGFTYFQIQFLGKIEYKRAK